jgi:hypothetical protein
MAQANFLPATALPRDLPFVPAKSLSAFPFNQIARAPEERLFRGPRVLWTDGAHPEDGVKAVYAEGAFSHQHSLAILAAPDTDEDRLTARFLTVYLRTPMGLWLLLLLSSSVASERPKLHLREALDWPFWPIKSHPAPEKAKAILTEVDKLLTSVEASDELLQPHRWDEVREQANALVYAYFGLTGDEVAMIVELSTLAGAALQPSSLRHQSLMKPLRQAPSHELMQDYARALSKTLGEWRDVTGGTGKMHVATWTGRSVPLGAAVLTVGDAAPVDRFADDSIIEILSAALQRVTAYSTETLLTIPDIAIVDGNRIFLVKPLVTRFWMRRCAVEDANRLALQLQTLSRERVRA